MQFVPSRRNATRGQLHLKLAVGLLTVLGIGCVPFFVREISPEHLPESTPGGVADLTDARHLIMVAGHAVYIALSRDAESVRREDSWHLEPFQKGEPHANHFICKALKYGPRERVVS